MVRNPSPELSHLPSDCNPIKGLLSALSYLLQGFDRLADNPEAFKDPGRVQVD